MITSISNPQMKQITAMIKKSKARNEADAYIVEGIRMVREIPAGMCLKVYVSESFLKEHLKELDTFLEEHKRSKGSAAIDTQVEVVSDKVFKEISDTQTPQGILAVVRRQHYSLEKLLSLEKRPLFLVLESIQDPGNLGTMLRMAEGAGVTGVIMNRSTVDIYNPKVVRSTMGSIFRVPFVYVDDLLAAAEKLHGAGVHLYAAHLKGENYYFQENYNAASAVLIGNEAAGLTDALAKKADTYIKIPMDGQVESLNAAMAATILMYEAKRQRILA